ncbi:phosphate acyltransferase [Aliiroseovarius crassostreae]|uniref:phosphate acyltransferase n=1 Tax=Aliiroseovarius crassostreae TaxID=154981 RepID=UPI0021AEBE83|nr:phosphate acyltransferase [Aliiroseovarius crassostreae]UWP89910.1 phosphate acetyltransferase [Aliiroseovarius crassostreae]UWQ02559.1 phosphate acetyltransferase [Aliiroseovarius crassostreae]
MDMLEKAKDVARNHSLRVVFPESDDQRVTQAMARLEKEGLAEPLGLPDVSQAQFDALMAARPMKAAIAERMLARPLIRAAAMLACGEADVMVAGAIAPTRRVIEAAALAVGYAPGIRTASSFFLMEMPDGRQLVLADCAVNTDPSAAELADIARASARSARVLLGRADVALLSFSTGSSGIGPLVDKVKTAAEATGFLGPIQGDAALNPMIAARKGAGGAGVANTLIFPDLNAGNIAYKLLQELAGAHAYGPILQGFRKPVCDLSRGATVDEIVGATLLSISLSERAVS